MQNYHLYGLLLFCWVSLTDALNHFVTFLVFTNRTEQFEFRYLREWSFCKYVLFLASGSCTELSIHKNKFFLYEDQLGNIVGIIITIFMYQIYIESGIKQMVFIVIAQDRTQGGC